MLTPLLLSLSSRATVSTLRTVLVTVLLLPVLLLVTAACLPALLVLPFRPSRDTHVLGLLRELRIFTVALLRGAR
ncbi:hypothetical protein ACFYYB_39870 [Streptomyces sp. NPDC002886]|uniref:hypothetical protein n=1 Tax=Streptomyces sp. NPDC002886 TaxID=3364667 RepID=UPI0036B713D7